MASLTISANVTATDSPLGTSGVTFVELSEGNDQFVFTAGSVTVADGQTVPTQQDLINAGVLLTGSEIILSTYLLSDLSANLLKSMNLMGDLNSRYVLAFDFDGATASEPVLEVWDDSNLDTITGTILGSGTPSQSFIRGITTTAGSSGAPGWAGNRLAGSGSGNFLFLNNGSGALSVATTLYANLKVIIPASQTVGFGANPVFVCKFLTN